MNAYAKTTLMPPMDQAALKEILHLEATSQTADPRYMELLLPHHYEKHVLRMPYAEWPDPVVRGLTHINPKIYVPMQGPSELAASGKLEHWDRNKEGNRAWLALNMMTEGRAGFRAFNEGSKACREADFLLLRRRMAEGATWGDALTEEFLAKAHQR